MHGVNPLCIAAQSSRFTSSHQVVGQRTESDRTADGIRSDGGRNPIGRRTESDRTANGIRSDGERNPAGGAAVSAAPTKQAERVFPQNTQNTQNRLAEMCRPQIGTDAHRLGGYGIPVKPTQPIAHPNFCGFREFRGRFFSASNSVRSVNSVGDSSQQVILWIPWIPWEILHCK